MSSVVAMLTIMLVCLLGAAPRASVWASRVADGAGGGILSVPSNASLAYCPTRCGDTTFSYPFGTEPGCFRQASSSPATTPPGLPGSSGPIAPLRSLPSATRRDQSAGRRVVCVRIFFGSRSGRSSG
ncbi:hypothetical protein PVAP13_1NG339457 [Panicum virgatum]|uniref:Uncharacterized protein n=1 Tax=Panicum virgatum TaxID=38727 RepID=A0A8T0X4I2_PANVG|nr:hypothetical protein PVAP13_1NG339457 [Panicum virgatum]